MKTKPNVDENAQPFAQEGVPVGRQLYEPLEFVTKPNLTTAETAYYLDRRPQTLRGWACNSGSGPLVPKRIGGLLAWSTAEVKTLAGVAL